MQYSPAPLLQLALLVHFAFGLLHVFGTAGSEYVQLVEPAEVVVVVAEVVVVVAFVVVVVAFVVVVVAALQHTGKLP